jgi:phosphoglycolate phosphatase-like HAD superfamily hydrolase
MQTATNAGMGAVGVSWGYRPKEELLADGAIHIIKSIGFNNSFISTMAALRKY